MARYTILDAGQPTQKTPGGARYTILEQQPTREYQNGSHIPNADEAFTSEQPRPARFGQFLEPYFGGHNPIAETYDTFVEPFVNEQRSPEDQAFLGQRSIPERVGDAASFGLSLPGRILTGGQYGLGDSLRSLGLSGPAASIESGERDFARANRPQLKALSAAGEVALAGTGAAMPKPSYPVARAAPAPRVAQIIDDAAGAVTGGPVTRSKAASRIEDAQAMREMDVTPFGPALSGTQSGTVAKQVSEIPIVGGPILNRMSEVVGQTRAAADRVAGGYGGMRTAQEGGQVVRQGLERFRDARPADIADAAVQGLDDARLSQIIRSPARDTSLKTKQAAVYERAWRNIPEAMREGAPQSMRRGRSVKELPRVLGGVPETMALIREIAGRNLRLITPDAGQRAVGQAGVAMPVQGGLLGRVVSDIHAGKWQGSLQTMRDLRSEFRRLASGMADTEKNVLKSSDIERIQSALTRDMVSLLDRNARVYAENGMTGEATGMRRAIGAFRQADRYTRMSMERLDRIERLFGVQSSEQVAQVMVRAALDRGRGNLDMLRQARRFLRDSEWDEFAGSMIHEMGGPTGSARGLAREQGFSLESFLTRWQNMAPEARSLLFRSNRNPALARDLDRLVRVIARLAEYEATANRSRTATNAIALTAVTGAAAGLISRPVTTIATVAGARAAASFLSSQTYVRWLTRAGQIQVMRPETRAAAWASHVAQLEKLARRDHELGGAVLKALAASQGFTQEPLDER